MLVMLDSKTGVMPRHTAEIDLDCQVAEQDMDLVRPGAVFYLTIFEQRRPAIRNVEELRFRRRPSWTRAQIAAIEADANAIGLKARQPRLSE